MSRVIGLLLIFLPFILMADEEWLIPGQTESQESLLPIYNYPGEPQEGAMDIILYRAKKYPLNVVSTLIFICAVAHILSVRKISVFASKIKPTTEFTQFFAEVLQFLGEVEIVFGIWVIPLLVSISLNYNWSAAVDYLNSRNYVEAIAVVVIMTLASTKPIVDFVERVIRKIAHFFGNTLSTWWLSLMIVGPILGAILTEAGAMILTAVLLGRKFYQLKPSNKLAYASLGLLFTNVSLGGIITIFASPPALLASRAWNWDSWLVFSNFGIKSIVIIALSSFLYFYLFRQEFYQMEVRFQEEEQKTTKEDAKKQIPIWITLGNVFFLLGIAYNVYQPVIFIGIYLFFLGFYQATHAFQGEMHLRSAFLVGFFIAGLVIHAGLQEWWIAPLFVDVSALKMMVFSLFIGPFTDNAALTYLATLIPDLSEKAKYAVMVGAVSAGGLTVIANAPNPAGQQILSPYFENGISPLNLFKGAFIPTLLAIFIFFIF